MTDRRTRRARKDLRKRKRTQREQQRILRDEKRLRRDERRLERKRDRLARTAEAGRDRSVLTPEERAYRDARARVNLRISVVVHAISYACVLALILVVSRSVRVMLIVGLAWGVGLATHYFLAVVVPEWRRRWIHQEVGRQVEHGVSRQRRAIEDRTVRSLEDLSASIAHEIRNPITAAKSLVQQMGEDPVSQGNIEYAGVALEELDRVERSISHLLRFARDEELHFEPLEIADVVDSALETFRDRIGVLGVEVEREIDSRGLMRGDGEKLRRVVINLIGNALDAMEDGSVREPRLEIASGENLAGTEVWLRIRDNGPGMEPGTLGKIFSPFYTTKDHGTGLGLALSKKVVDAHGATLEVRSAPGEGSEFLLGFNKQIDGGGGGS